MKTYVFSLFTSFLIYGAPLVNCSPVKKMAIPYIRGSNPIPQLLAKKKPDYVRK